MKRESTVNLENEEELDEEPRNLILNLISQLGKNRDLSRVTFPTFVLEPRSFTERVTDFMTHPDILIKATEIDDPLERFVVGVKYYMSGWHIHPKGVKKPYNPILGEFFRTKYELGGDKQAYFVAEQVSHHPPITAMYYHAPDHGVIIQGDLRPKSRFFGNSVGMILGGYGKVYLLKRDEEYDVTYPNMYARGILFGKMVLELGERSTIVCKKNDLIFEVDFKTKGLFSGGYNEISGKIRKISTKEVLYEVFGNWQSKMYLKKKGVKGSAAVTVLFDSAEEDIVPVTVQDIEEQEDNESRRLWRHVTKAIKERDLDAATDEKSKIENAQRETVKEREANGDKWSPRFFKEENGNFVPKIDRGSFNVSVEEQHTMLESLVFSKPSPAS